MGEDLEAQPERADILVVDDNPESLRVLTEMLRLQGYDVRPAASGKRALASARKLFPDLILLDICMPEMSGYEVCRQLKEDESTRDIPVLFLSALDDPADKLRAFREGGLDFIVKPFHEAEVLIRIQTQLTILRQRRQIESDYQRLKQLYAQQQRERERLAQSEASRRDFLADVSHNLGTPLTAIMGWLALLAEAAPEESPVLVDKVTRETAFVSRRVRQLLEMARCEGDPRVVAEEINLLDPLMEVVDALERRAEECGAELVFQGLESGLKVRADSMAVREIFQVLLENALDHARPCPRVTVSVRALGARVEIAVSDDGRGIHPERMQAIQTRFAGSSSERGAGLGLAIAHKLALALGGELLLRSPPGGGTQARFSLARASTAAPAAPRRN